MSCKYPDTVPVEDVPQSNTLVTRSRRHIVSIRVKFHRLCTTIIDGNVCWRELVCIATFRKETLFVGNEKKP